MQAIAYEGYFNNGQFYVSGKAVNIPEKRRVFLTILDDAQDIENDTANNQEWLDNFFGLLQTATVELHENDFPRLNFELVNVDEI